MTDLTDIEYSELINLFEKKIKNPDSNKFSLEQLRNELQMRHFLLQKKHQELVTCSHHVILSLPADEQPPQANDNLKDIVVKLNTLVNLYKALQN